MVSSSVLRPSRFVLFGFWSVLLAHVPTVWCLFVRCYGLLGHSDPALKASHGPCSFGRVARHVPPKRTSFSLISILGCCRVARSITKMSARCQTGRPDQNRPACILPFSRLSLSLSPFWCPPLLALFDSILLCAVFFFSLSRLVSRL